MRKDLKELAMDQSFEIITVISKVLQGASKSKFSYIHFEPFPKPLHI